MAESVWRSQNNEAGPPFLVKESLANALNCDWVQKGFLCSQEPYFTLALSREFPPLLWQFRRSPAHCCFTTPCPPYVRLIGCALVCVYERTMMVVQHYTTCVAHGEIQPWKPK